MYPPTVISAQTHQNPVLSAIEPESGMLVGFKSAGLGAAPGVLAVGLAGVLVVDGAAEVVGAAGEKSGWVDETAATENEDGKGTKEPETGDVEPVLVMVSGPTVNPDMAQNPM